MLEAKDLKYLKRSQTRGARIGGWVLAVVACVFIVVGVLNVRLAAKLGTMQGMGVQELFQRWLPGPQVTEQYSGAFLLAVNRLQTGITEVVYGLVIAVIFYAYNKSRQRNKRILKFIEDKRE
jgi:hypothetical protein